jgi:GH15 family glucan-1,4-alpha-glucosidase
VQHGSYGDLFSAVARYVDHGGHLDTETGLILAKLADQLCDEWPKPDAGLWELPEDRPYTTSLVNSWVALSRAASLARRGEISGPHADRWEQNSEQIREFVDRHCWSDSKRSYTFYADSDDLDAAVLLAARTGFLAPDDPRLHGTIDAVRRELTAEGPLVYRYTGAAEKENAFVACTFWLIEAMSIAGRVEEAGSLLESALRYSSDLGLWSEEIEPGTGILLGNFPIGLSHLAALGAITSFASAASRFQS